MTLATYLAIAMGCIGTYCVACRDSRRRVIGWCLYLAANCIWILYGFSRAEWPIVWQFVLYFLLSVRGLYIALTPEGER